MTNEVKNVPELRFPELEGEWEEKKLGEISEKPMYGIGASATNFDGENVYVRITDINEKNRTLINSTLTSPDTIDLKYNLNKNDILFARTGASTGKTYIHKNYDKNKTYYFAGFLIKFKIKNNSIPEFVYQYTFTNNYNNWVAIMSIRSGQPGINSEEYSKMSLYLPSYKEQQKIGDFFSKLDQQIELEEKKLALLEEQKKGYMHKIFSQELRFKDEKGNDYPEWEERCFFENIQKTLDCRGKTPKKLGMEWSDSGYLALSAINVKNGYIDFSVEANYGDENLYHKWMQGKELKKGQVLFTTEAPMGNVAQVPDNRGYILSQRTIAFEVDNNKITNGFLFVLLNSSQVHNRLTSLSSGATAKGVSQKSLKKLHVNLPESLMEQEKISDFFCEFDQIVGKQNQKVELLKERKKGFLQKMFV